MKEVVLDGVVELLKNWVEDPVVEREVAMSVRVDQPARQGRLCAGQLALDGVLEQHGHRLLAEGAVPFEGLTLKDEGWQ